MHEHNSTIDCLLTHSVIRALSGDTKSIDGFRPLLGIVDEYHAHRNNQMYKLLEGGIKKMKSALISVITTAGFDLKSPCFKLYEYCMNVLKGVTSNDTQFIYIAQMDETDDLWLPENWIKANPILEYKYILSHLKKLITKYEFSVQMICYDPHNASAFLGDLEGMGYDSLGRMGRNAPSVSPIIP